MRYIDFDNLMNESLSFTTILTKVTFVTTSVAYLMHDPTCFVFLMPLGTFILSHVLLPKPDTPVCQTGQSSFNRLALKLLFLDKQLYCVFFLGN
jgi:hypothetical protein